MRKLSFPCSVVILILLGMCGPAHATFVPIGDIMGGSSWGQRFQYEGPPVVNFMQAIWSSGDKFELPTAIRNITPGPWPQCGGSTTVPWAYNGVTGESTIAFDLWFSGSPDTGMTRFWIGFADAEGFKAAYYVNNEGLLHNWIINYDTHVDEYPPLEPIPQIPEPSALLTMGLCLAIGSLGAFRRRPRT